MSRPVPRRRPRPVPLRRLVLASLVVPLAACGGGDGDDGPDDEPRDGDRAGDTSVCDAVPQETRDRIDDAVREAGYESGVVEDPRVSLLPTAGHFVACTLVPDFLVVGVQAYADGRTVDDLFTTDDELRGPGEPLDGVGDRALIGTNSYDGTRIAVESQGTQVLVDSNFYEGSAGAPLSRALLVDLAEVVTTNLELPVAPVVLPDACPAADAAPVVEEAGEVVLARGTTGGSGTSCEYLSADRTLALAAVQTDVGTLGLSLGDAGDPIDLDGDDVYLVDDDEAVLVTPDTCAVQVTTSPLGYELADQRSDDELRTALLDLVAFARDEIGCD